MGNKYKYSGKIKLYADENIRYGVVLVLRQQGINIIHSSEVGLNNKDDQAQFQYAKKKRRWLLTTDKDFLDHKRFPFEHIKGIVIVPDTGEDLMAGQIIVWIKQELVPSGIGIDHCKVEFFREKVRFHFRREGRIYRQELSFFNRF